MAIEEIKTIDQFTSTIGNNDTGLVVVDFFADWCGPCKRIAPAFAKLAEKYQNVGFYKINTDNLDIAKVVEICDIKSLPTFCLFRGGKYITRMLGSNDKDLEKMIVQNLPHVEV